MRRRRRALDDYEAERVCKDGSRIVVALTGSGEYDESGHLIGISTIARDITAQKAAERKLAESSRHFELIKDLIATCGFDGYFKQLNGAWERVLGRTQEELLPNPFIEVIHPPDRAAVEAEVAAPGDGATTSEFKLRLMTADGSLLWTEWSASPDTMAPVFHCAGRVIQGRAWRSRRRSWPSVASSLTPSRSRWSGSWELDLDDRRAHLVGAALSQPRLRARTRGAAGSRLRWLASTPRIATRREAPGAEVEARPGGIYARLSRRAPDASRSRDRGRGAADRR